MGSKRKHGTAWSVKVPRDGVEEIHSPRGDGPEGNRVGSDATVDGGARRSRQLPCHLPDRVWIDAGEARHNLWRERRHNLASAIEPVCQVGESVESDQSFFEQNLGDGQQESGIGAGPDRNPPVCHCRRLRATRINYHHLATASPDVL
jgi:hypothetical protein